MICLGVSEISSWSFQTWQRPAGDPWRFWNSTWRTGRILQMEMPRGHQYAYLWFCGHLHLCVWICELNPAPCNQWSLRGKSASLGRLWMPCSHADLSDYGWFISTRLVHKDSGGCQKPWAHSACTEQFSHVLQIWHMPDSFELLFICDWVACACKAVRRNGVVLPEMWHVNLATVWPRSSLVSTDSLLGTKPLAKFSALFIKEMLNSRPWWLQAS